MSPAPPFRLPKRQHDSHKGTFGRVLLIGGSRGMAGSIAISAIAALKSGSGLVSVAIPDACLETVASFHPAIMTIPIQDDASGAFAIAASETLEKLIKSVDAAGIGPGMTTKAGSVRIVERLFSSTRIEAKRKPLVFDADALNCISELQTKEISQNCLLATKDDATMVVTPHPGELQRLTGISSADRNGQIRAAEKLAKDANLIVVLKGGPTVVVDGKQTYTNGTGNPGMATAGSGDALTGVVTSFLGQGLTPWKAACLAVWVHGRAGDLAAAEVGVTGMTAVEILDHLPTAMTDIQP